MNDAGLALRISRDSRRAHCASDRSWPRSGEPRFHICFSLRTASRVLCQQLHSLIAICARSAKASSLFSAGCSSGHVSARCGLSSAATTMRLSALRSGRPVEPTSVASVCTIENPILILAGRLGRAPGSFRRGAAALRLHGDRAPPSWSPPCRGQSTSPAGNPVAGRRRQHNETNKNRPKEPPLASSTNYAEKLLASQHTKWIVWSGRE